MWRRTEVSERSGSGTRTGPTAAGLLLGALVAPGLLGISAAVIALPSLSGDLGLTTPRASWLLAGYVLAQAMFVAVFGRLGDIWGIRAVLLAGATLIVTGSLLSSLGDSFVVLVGGRLLQGAGAGSLQLVAFATAGARYTGADRAKVLGIVTAIIGVVSGSGTLIGGALTDSVSWRVVMALPVLSVLAMVAAVHLAPATRSAATGFDAPGAVLVALLASAIVLLLESPSSNISGGCIAVVGVIAVLAIALLWRRVGTVPGAFIPRAVVSSRASVLAALAALMLGAGYLAMLFAAPLLLGGHGWSVTQIGLVLVPAGLLSVVSARIVGSLVTTHDSFRVTAALAAISAVGLLLAGLAGHSAICTVLGLGMAVSALAGGQVALLHRVPLLVEPDMRAVATGLFILMFLLGMAVGSALVAGLISPLGLSTAVGAAAVLPSAGVLLALTASAASDRPPPRTTAPAD